MSVIYNVRIKVSAPKFKVKFVDGLYIANDIVDDVAQAKEKVVAHIRDKFDVLKKPSVECEVVLFRRSNIGFILSDPIEDLENPN